MYPGSRVAAVMHRVIDQPHVPAHGRSQPRGGEIRLGGDGILLIAEIIAEEREHFEQHLAEIRRMRLLPVGQNSGHAVLHQAEEAFEILCEIRDVDGGWCDWRAILHRQTIERTRAQHFERKINRRQHEVDSGWRLRGIHRIDKAQRIRGEISRPVDLHHQAQRIARG